MDTDDLFKISRLLELLDEVMPVLVRYHRETLPLILEHERAFDHHRQMSLPLHEPQQGRSCSDFLEVL